MTEIVPEDSEVKEKLHSLKRGDFIYVHPADPTNIATFGMFSFFKFDCEGVAVEDGLFFSYAKVLGVDVWCPKIPRHSSRTYFRVDEFLDGRRKLYVGEEDIRRGMEENNNPNYALVERIMTGKSAEIS